MQMGGSANNTHFPNAAWKTNYNNVCSEAELELLYWHSLTGVGVL